MSFASYSLTPSANTTIAGFSMADNTTSPSAMNDAVRQLMSDGREIYDLVNAINLSAYAGLASPAFTGQPTVATRGAILHFNNAANASGRVHIQASGAALPTLANGDQVWTY